MDPDHVGPPIISNSLFNSVNIYFMIPANVIITIMGALTNSANIIVFTKMSPADTMTMSLTALAVSDLMFSLFNLFYYVISSLITAGVQVLLQVHLESLLFVGFVWQRPLFPKISAMITTFVSCERSLCVVKPFLVKRMFTRRRCMAILIFIYLSLTIMFMPVYVNGRLVWSHGTNVTDPVLVAYFTSERPTAEAVVHFGAAFALVFSSQVIITIAAIFMAVGLRRHQQFRQSTVRTKGPLEKTKAINDIGKDQVSDTKDATDSNTQARSSKEDRLIKTVLILAIMHIVINTPLLVYYLTSQLNPEFRLYKRYNNFYLIATDIANILQTLNGLLNIFVYLTLNTKYRSLFKETFLTCC